MQIWLMEYQVPAVILARSQRSTVRVVVVIANDENSSTSLPCLRVDRFPSRGVCTVFNLKLQKYY